MQSISTKQWFHLYSGKVSYNFVCDDWVITLINTLPYKLHNLLQPSEFFYAQKVMWVNKVSSALSSFLEVVYLPMVFD